MSIYKQTGPNRLAKFITVAAFVVAYVVLYNCVDPWREGIFSVDGINRDGHNLFVFPFWSAVIAITTFWVVRFVYWVIDGFIGRNSSDEKLNYPD